MIVPQLKYIYHCEIDKFKIKNLMCNIMLKKAVIHSILF